MTGAGIMHVVRRILLTMLLVVPATFAQTKPAPQGDDLDVTMRVIVDPNAKVPDEIVRRIPLPKPAQTDAPSGKPAEPGTKDDRKPSAAPGQQGREFGQAVADEAKRRAEEAKKNKPPPPVTPGTPGPPRPPPGRPPG